jgi:predicted phosphoadenosine phosphosulfate sulfurtransferase
VLGVYDLEKGEVWLSFNGGKDATVVLQLVVMALSEMGETERLKGIYL